MGWQYSFYSSCLFLAVASGAAVLQQQPLQLNDLSDLRDEIGARFIQARPVASPCYLSSSSQDCATVKKFKSDDIWTSNQPAGYFYANWASCQANAQTCALPMNGSEIPPGSTCYQGSVPSYVIKTDSMDTLYDDIDRAFVHARDSKRPLVIKNTGHDWKGRSAAPESLALWTHHLQDPAVPIEIDRNFTPTGCSSRARETVFHFGPGEQWAGAYKFAEKHGLAVLGGTCGTVGIAGWLQGGGHSPLTPWYGMGVDNVREVEIVTPKLGKLIANECQNTDLFFAVRGGGGGTFGVITKITYKAIERFAVQDFRFKFDSLNQTSMREYFELLTSNAIKWSQKGWGGYIRSTPTGANVELSNANATLTGAKADMQPLIRFLEARNVTYVFKSQPSWFAYFKENLEPASVHVGGYSGAVASRLLPPSLFSDESRKKLVDALVDLYDNKLNLWLMLVTPTVFPHTTTSALHPTWKEAVWSVRVNDRWDQFWDGRTPSDVHRHFEKVHEKFETIRALAPGMGTSINEADIWEDEPEKVFWGADNYELLTNIKDQVDPENLLSTYAAVNWNPDDTRYKCYPKKPT